MRWIDPTKPLCKTAFSVHTLGIERGIRAMRDTWGEDDKSRALKYFTRCLETKTSFDERGGLTIEIDLNLKKLERAIDKEIRDEKRRKQGQ